ncbi:PEX25 [Candida pseudojiufengensis]|uniref:PEX25 n=1 Tax=Candida pseudojiufengensis TaxID=497109 RepID=UPI00222415AB|nr:PEX25 [Candida pseudojiufengensis]KAI5963089.1 PEX25 [Candida pseudojiufengensis]
MNDIDSSLNSHKILDNLSISHSEYNKRSVNTSNNSSNNQQIDQQIPSSQNHQQSQQQQEPDILHIQPQQINSIHYQQYLQHLQHQHNQQQQQQQLHQRNIGRSPLYPSSKLYSQPPQSFNSEWIEEGDTTSPIISPTKSINYKIIEENNPKMSSTSTTTQINHKYETPSKNLKTYAYITPNSNQKIGNTPLNNNETFSENHSQSSSISTTIESSDKIKSTTTTTTTIQKSKSISNWNIFWLMLNDIVGKDKMAKVGQYTLRLLVFYANKSQLYLSDENLNIKIINNRYNDSTKQLELIKNFIKHPKDFIKIILILVCSTFKDRISGVINGLSMYRQFLRFGKTPFRIRDLVIKFSKNINLNKNNKDNKDLEINKSQIFNRTTLGQIFSLYYGINDESILLFKLNFLKSPNLKKFVTQHESYSWYCETWLALYNAYEDLNNLTQQEMDLKIQIQVKNKARILSKQILGNNTHQSQGQFFNHSNTSSNFINLEDQKLLNSIQFKKNNAWLDIYKNLADLGFNTYSVFNILLPFDTWQIWMGILASSLSTIKLYRLKKQELLINNL